MLESTFLQIQNIALFHREHIMKVSGISIKGDLQNTPCTLDLIMCKLEDYMLDSIFLEIENIALPYSKYIMKVSGPSIKEDL